MEKTIAPIFEDALYSSEGSVADLPPIGFCIQLLLGSKYAGVPQFSIEFTVAAHFVRIVPFQNTILL